MSTDLQERQSTAGRSRTGTIVIGLLVLLLLSPSFRSAVGLVNRDPKCAPWPSRQGEWYSVPPELLTVTADYPRMVDKSGVWSKTSFGLTSGWIYAVKTPDGPLAYWAVAKDEKAQRTAIYDSDGQLVEERFVSWKALNDEALSLSLSATRVGMRVNPTNVNRMLTDQIKDSIAHCLGY